MKKLLFASVAALGLPAGCVYYERVPEYSSRPLAPAQSVRPISMEEVVRLSKAGVGDEVVIAKVRSDGLGAKLTADDITALKKDGVSDHVLEAMVSAPVQIPGEADRPPVIYHYYPSASGYYGGWAYSWDHYYWDHHGWGYHWH